MLRKNLSVNFFLFLSACTYKLILMFFLYKADFKNTNLDNIYVRMLIDLDNRIRRCLLSNSFENILTVMQNRCVPPKCDLKKLLWYMYATHENMPFLDEDSWNSNKIKKNFDEIDKTSASFSTLNQLI